MLWNSRNDLSLPITASLKVLFRKFKPIGFVLGEADDKYFSNKAKIV
jgi:hypothetical protein